jgi:hypothetical protein
MGRRLPTAPSSDRRMARSAETRDLRKPKRKPGPWGSAPNPGIYRFEDLRLCEKKSREIIPGQDRLVILAALRLLPSRAVASVRTELSVSGTVRAQNRSGATWHKVKYRKSRKMKLISEIGLDQQRYFIEEGLGEGSFCATEEKNPHPCPLPVYSLSLPTSFSLRPFRQVKSHRHCFQLLPALP